jgi:DNA-binding XRE family transcriptional regulator
MTNLKAWRIMNRLTQDRASRLLGLSPLTFAYLEAGRLRPKDRELACLRAYFGGAAEQMLESIDLPAGCTGQVTAL